MKILSWNIAGIRASLKRGDLDFLLTENYDIVCIQETKADECQVFLDEKIKEMYPYRYWSNNKGTTQRKGFSGTTIWSIKDGILLNSLDIDEEGRVTCLEYEDFILVNVYTPNSQNRDSDRFKFRINIWDNNFRNYIYNLNKQKDTIICGDFNVAHKDIDVYEPKKKKNRAGFLDEEKDEFQKHLDMGYIDAFRYVCKEENQYTYWDQRFPHLRKNNRGWRIDYFIVPESFCKKIKNCNIHKDILGSDHCPISIVWD